MQKGRIPGVPVCLEHSRVVTQLIREAREGKDDLAVLQLDLDPVAMSDVWQTPIRAFVDDLTVTRLVIWALMCFKLLKIQVHRTEEKEGYCPVPLFSWRYSNPISFRLKQLVSEWMQPPSGNLPTS